MHEIIDDFCDGNWWFVNGELVNAVRTLRSCYDSAMDELEEAESACEEYEGVLRDASEELESLKLLVNDLREENARLKADSDAGRLESECDRLTVENDFLREKAKALELQIYCSDNHEELRKQVQHLQFLITSAKHILEDRSSEC